MLNIGSKTFRNLPEQVAENLKQIGLIWQKLDGLDVYDNVIIIEDVSNLNEEQLAIVARPVSFIVYQDVVYVKKATVGAYVLFSPYYSIEADEYITIKSSELKVQFPLGEVTITGVEVELYDKDEIDILLGDKADKDDTYDKAEVDSLLLSKVFPVGAIFTSSVGTSPASLFGGSWEAYNSGNPVKICNADDKVPVKCFDEHASTGILAFKYANGSSIDVSNRHLLGLYGNALTEYSDGGNGAVNNLNISNLWAEVGTATQVYMWKRIA